MFLTRMFLNPTRVTTRRMLSSPQVTHALVLGGFSPTSSGGRVLWRLDVAGPELALYVVSADRPDFTGVVEQAGWPTGQAWETRDYAPFLGRLEAGQRWRFRLTANPVRSVSRGVGTRGRVSPHRTVDHQRSWLLGRAERLGVVFPPATGSDDGQAAAQVVVQRRARPSFVRRSGAGDEARRDRVDLTTATYEGVLDVVDPERLRNALTKGVGRAKGYGCGLMTLASP